MDFWFYGVNLFFLLVYVVMYADFRDGVQTAVQLPSKRKDKNFFDRLWWSDIHREKDLGLWYRYHQGFTVLFAVVSVLFLATGYLATLQLLWIFLLTLVGLLLIPMNFYAFVQHNRADYGRPFVWFEKRKHGAGGFRSSILDVFWSLFPLLMAAFNSFLLM